MDEKLQKYILSISLPSDTRVNDIKILGVIGVGNHGIVYEALDTVTQQIVALKEFFPVRLASRDKENKVIAARPSEQQQLQNSKKRFLEKGLKISRIHHPNVIRLSRVIEENDTVYLMMDKVDGVLLSERLGPTSFVPPETKKQWVEQLLDAVERIHLDGTLHLAIEPNNIILSEKHGPVLIDFGDPETHESNANAKTSPYEAIEMVNGNLGRIDKWSDIYSAGAVFYHLISGDPPVPASSRSGSKTDPQPKLTSIQSLKSNYPRTLLNSIDGAIAIKPENRFTNVAEWKEAFSDTEEAKTRMRSRIQYGAAAGIFILVAGWLLFGKDYYAESKLWNEVQADEDPCVARQYIEQFPNGRFAEQAGVSVSLCEERELAEQQRDLELRMKKTSRIVGETVRVQPGCFYMGSELREEGRGTNERLHEACIEAPYELAAREVTVAQFKAFVKETDYKTDAERNVNDTGCWALDPDLSEEPWAYHAWASWQSPFKNFAIDDSHPVVCLSPNDVQQYLNWLNQIADTKFRLPTEAEWEYAARGRGQPRSRPWGNNPSDACRYGNIADQTNIPELTKKLDDSSPWPFSHNCRDEYLYTAPVATYSPDFHGFYDMIGNAWEMTCSMYSGSYAGMELECADVEEEPTLTDKGGSWESDPNNARSATRGQIPYYARGSNIGFRLARSIE